MKKLGLFIGMAAFLAAGMLFWGCDKMGNDELNLPKGLVEKNVSTLVYNLYEIVNCEEVCIPKDDGSYYEQYYETTVEWGNKGNPFSKTVNIIVYNTENQFVIKVKSTDGFADLVIDEESSWTDRPVAADTWGVLELDLPEAWDACNDYNFALQVTGNGPPAVFAVEYQLIGICQSCEIRTESAWADGSRYIEKGNWATYTEFVDGAKVAIFAGKDILVGYVTLSMVSAVDINDEPTDETFQDLNFELINGWTLEDVNENVKIEGYDEAPPSGNPAPGQFELYKETLGGLNSWGISFGIEKHWKYFGIHLDVEICE